MMKWKNMQLLSNQKQISNDISFSGYKNAEEFLKRNARALKKIMPEARKDFSLNLNDEFVAKAIKDEVKVGQVTVYKKIAGKTEPVQADIMRQIDSDNLSIYRLCDKGSLIGIISVYQQAEDSLKKFLNKKHNYIGFMRNMCPEKYEKVGRALHDVAKVQTLADDKRMLALLSINTDAPPVGFHSKNGYWIMSKPNHMKDGKADNMNYSIRENSVIGVKNIFKKLNSLYMCTILPKK